MSVLHLRWVEQGPRSKSQHTSARVGARGELDGEHRILVDDNVELVRPVQADKLYTVCFLVKILLN
jgi:hypothetical protein